MRGWSGPPRLLIAATLLAFGAAPLLGTADEQHPSAGVRLSSSAPEPPAVASGPPSSRPTIKPQRQVIGVVSFNQFRKLSGRETSADARALARRDDVDVIAWQESYESRAAHRELRRLGWRTRRFPRSARELALSWRHADWRYVSADVRRVAEGMSDEVARYPFPDRFAARVTLEQRATGHQLSVVNTHLPQKIEDLERPGRWARTYNAARARRHLARLKRLWDKAPGRWVVGAGDYNVDARAEADVRPQEGLSRVMAGRGVSTYDELGFRGLSGATHPTSGRYIDYVFASRKGVRLGRVELTRHRVLRGFNSDHRPLQARIALK